MARTRRPVRCPARMVVPELAIPLATGIHKVFRSGEPLTYTNVRLQRHDRQRHLTIRIFPMPETKGQPLPEED